MLEIPIPDNYKPRKPSNGNGYQRYRPKECNAKEVSIELQQKYSEPVYPVCPVLKEIISKEKRYSLPDIPKTNLPLLDSVMKIVVVFECLIQLKPNLETVVRWAHSENLLKERLDPIRGDLSLLPGLLEKANFPEISKKCNKLITKLKWAEFSMEGQSFAYILTNKLWVELQYFLDGKSLPSDFVFDNRATFLRWRNLKINQAGLSDKPEMHSLTRYYPAEAIEVMRKIYNELYPSFKIVAEQTAANNQIADTVLEKVMAWLKLLLEKASSKAEETKEPQPENYIRKGSVWQICFEGQTVFIDSKLDGLRYIEYLLQNPGKTYSALDVETAAKRMPSDKAVKMSVIVDDLKDIENDTTGLTITNTGRTIDTRALAKADTKDLKAAIDKLKGQIETAKTSEKDSLENQVDVLKEELKKRTGKGGKARPQNDPYEQARGKVRAAVKVVVDKIKIDHDKLYKHFHLFLKVGSYCSYTPEKPMDWRIF
jgi:hypothetical protein